MLHASEVDTSSLSTPAMDIDHVQQCCQQRAKLFEERSFKTTTITHQTTPVRASMHLQYLQTYILAKIIFMNVLIYKTVLKQRNAAK